MVLTPQTSFFSTGIRTESQIDEGFANERKITFRFGPFVWEKWCLRQLSHIESTLAYFILKLIIPIHIRYLVVVILNGLYCLAMYLHCRVKICNWWNLLLSLGLLTQKGLKSRFECCKSKNHIVGICLYLWLVFWQRPSNVQ